MKKKQIFLKTIVAILLLSAMIVSTLLGTSNAEYFKSFKKTLSLEMKPDLNLSYHLRDYPNLNTSLVTKNGTYKNSNSFTQEIVVGKTGALPNSGNGNSNSNSDDYKKYKDYAYANMPEWWENENTKYTGEKIVYQIKIPVDETGYYTLDFAVDFWKDGEAQTQEFYTITYDRAVGCEILNYNDGIAFGSNTPLDLYTRSNNDAVYTTSTYATKTNVKRFESDGAYQWKTLAPSRQEHVTLSFRVDDGDVANGYVIWAWAFSGLYGPQKYVVEFTDVEVEKVMNLDGTTNNRDSNDPYFMFPQTDLVNNQLVLSLPNYSNIQEYDVLGGKTLAKGEVRGVQHEGRTSYSQGRGTFVTGATTNSLQIQAESLYYGFEHGGSILDINSANGDSYTNPLAFYVPVKNVKPGVTYKVTFDLSIARQGTYTVDGLTTKDIGTNKEVNAINRKAMTNNYVVDYATYSNIFKNGTNVFSSYLTNGRTDRSVYHHQEAGMTQITYNNKFYNGKYQYKDLNGNTTTMYAPLTKYDEVSSTGNIYNSISTSVNDTYSITKIEGDMKSATRNWYNAVQNIEYNGQNKINWLTFYNTTFSFNIDSASSNGLTIDPNTGYITNLEWAWVIDSVIPMSYYRIRLDNVRIQEVVEYGSFLDRNGVLIGDEKLTTNYADHFDKDTDNYNPKTSGWLNGLFVSYRGTNGTGQNFQAKGSVLNEYTALKNAQVFMSEGNIYAPIVDAAKIPIANGKDSDYKIAISGYAVCQGGIDRYVFSVDGGITWHDMTLNGIDTDARSAGSYLSKAGNAVNQYASGQTGYHKQGTNNGNNEFTWTDSDLRPTYDECTHIAFTSNDAANGNFKAMDNGMDSDPDPDMGWCLTANLSAFKHQGDLDIIIAAVPETNQDLRCEILRIINYNATQKYYTHAQNIVSDIKVTNKDDGVSLLNAFYYPPENINDNCENKESFTALKGYRADSVTSKTQQQLGAYTNRFLDLKNYEDVPAIFSDIPVYTKLSISGWAAAEKGIESFYWTVDGGKTWYPCGNDASASYGDTKTISLNTTDGSIANIKDRLTAWWGTTYTDDEIKSMSSYFHKWDVAVAGEFTGYIQADLSAYEGQVVDVLFAAKPNQSDVYVPVAKVDNVGVYGAQGTFYTRLDDLPEDNTVNGAAGIIIDNHGTGAGTVVANETTVTTAIQQEIMGKWNISATDGFNYTIFDVSNVNPANSRYYTDQLVPIKSGGRVSISGYVVFKAGIESYQFSLDGGETWTIIDDKGAQIADKDDANDPAKLANAKNVTSAVKYSDATLNETDAINGCFILDRIEDKKANTPQLNADAAKNYMLSFNIPAFQEGSTKDLLVVAVGKDDSGKEKMAPVVHLKLKILGTADGVTGWGYYCNFHNPPSGWVGNSSGNIRATSFKASSEENLLKCRDKLTIPVTQAGSYELSFSPYLYMNNTASGTLETAKKVACTVYHDDGEYTTYSNMDMPIVLPDADNVMASWGYTYNEQNGKYTVDGVANGSNVTLDIEVTKADVARGYIVLEWNVTQVSVNQQYYFRVANYTLTKNQ